MSTDLVKKPAMFDKIKGDALMGLMDTILPKIEPFLEDGVTKLDEYFGDDEKAFYMKKINGKIMVFVFNNKIGKYKIETGENAQFNAEKDSIITIINLKEFMTKLLSGELAELMKGE